MEALQWSEGVVTSIDYLHGKSEPVVEVNDTILQAIDEMSAVMKQHQGWLGISGVQVGYKYNICLIRENADTVQIVINPKIHGLGFQFSNESCTSAGKHRYGVWRPLCGLVTYYDTNMEKHTKFVGKRLIRVYCHEFDHFNGKLICDNGRRWVFDSKTRGHYLPKGR